MATISAKLKSILDNLAKQLPGNTSGDAYKSILDALNASPDLAQQMNDAANNGALKAINYTAGDGADFDPSSSTMELSTTMLNDMVSQATSTDPAQASNGLSSLVSLLGHETSHANGSQDEYNAHLNYMQSYGIQDGASATDWVRGYREIGLANEASASITGWNDAVEAATLANNGPLTTQQIQSLARGDSAGYVLFQQDASGNILPVSGLTLNADGTVDLANTGNIEAVSSVMRGIQPSTDAENETYLSRYTYDALNAAAQETTAPLRVSFSALGLTVPSRSPDLSHASTSTDAYDSEAIASALAAGDYGRPTTIVNTDDGTVATFTSNANKTTDMALQFAMAKDGTLSSEHANIAHDGTRNFGDIVNMNADGTTDVFVDGHGDVVAISNASVTLMPDTDATIEGNQNSIGFNKSDRSTVTVSGRDNIVRSSGHRVTVAGVGSTLTIDDTYALLTLKDSNQTVTMGQGVITAGNDLVGETIQGVTPQTSPGQGGPVQLVNITAGNNDGFTIKDIGVYYNGGTNNTVHATGGNYAIVSAGAGSDVDATLISGGYATLTLSNSTAELAGAASGSLTGSENTIALDRLTSMYVSGDKNTVTGFADAVEIYGDENIAILDDGVDLSVGGQGNTLSLSRGTISATQDQQTFNGSFNEFTYLEDGEYTVHGDQNAIDVTNGTLSLDGSGNIVSGYDEILNLTGGSGDDIQLEESTITAGDDADFTLSGDTNSATTGRGNFTITGGQNNVSSADGSAFTVSGWSNTITVKGGSITASLDDTVLLTLIGDGNTVDAIGGDFTIHGQGSQLAVADAAVQLDGDSSVVTHISGSGDTVTVSNATIQYTGDDADGKQGSRKGLTLLGSGDIVTASHSTITLESQSGDGQNLTVLGEGNTLSADLAAVTVHGTTMNDEATLDGYYAQYQTDVGAFALKGVENTYHLGDGSKVHVESTSQNILYVSNAVIQLDDDSSLTVYGNNNTFTGGSSSSLTITGTGNSVTATNSDIRFIGDNTGDVVFGAGDTGSNWSAPDPDLPPGDHGGYQPPSGTRASVDHLVQAMSSFGGDHGAGVAADTLPASHVDSHTLMIAAA